MPAFKSFILVSDHFYENPDAVADIAKKLKYKSITIATGYRSNELYQETKMKYRFERILSIKIKNWRTDINTENGIFFYAFSKGKLKETPTIHVDTPYHEITAVVYLTPDVPIDCGTSFWRHKKTALSKAPTSTDAKKLKMSLKDLKQLLEDDAEKRSAWTETDRIGYRYNRLIAFPSGVFHSATNHYGTDVQNGRIIQTFRIGVDWSTFQKK